MLALQQMIENAFELKPEHLPPEVTNSVDEVIRKLESGELRVAEKIDGEWVTHQWIKKAVLLSFRINPNRIMRAGDMSFYDKVPLRFQDFSADDWAKTGIRCVPGAVVRQGSYIAPGVVLMPSFVNIGAHIGENTMVDTWSTVGSCAQVGKNCHLSGGVGIAYKPEDTPNNIAAIGEGVHQAFNEILVPAGLGDVEIYTEMGRFMMGPYGCLVTRAIHEKHIYKEYIGVDACAANLMRPAMYGAYHHITVMGKENEPCDHMYDIVGALCENNDKFAIDRMLPRIEKGDILVIHDTGAHGFAMGYNYNGRLWSSEILLKEDGTPKLIRRAQTVADYFATFDCFDELKGKLQ